MSRLTDSNNKGQEDGAKDTEGLKNFLCTNHSLPYSSIQMAFFDNAEEAKQHQAENEAYGAGYENAANKK